MQYTPGILQDQIPVCPFLHRKVKLENEVRPCHLVSNTCHRFADHIHQTAPCLISVERRHDLGSLRQPDDSRLDQVRLPRTRFATQAGITGLVLCMSASRRSTVLPRQLSRRSIS